MINTTYVNKKKVFAPLLPPPNITGKLHLGHFFDQLISQIYINYHSLLGYSSFFAPFIDYGGISTEALIKKRYGLINNKNIKEFEIEYKSLLIKDLNDSGFSFSKKYLLYTLDKDYGKLVNKTFFSLFNKKLLKRFQYIVNWCNSCCTVISDEEVVFIGKEKELFYLKYFFNKDEYIIVATTKPETIFFDEFIISNIKNDNIKEVEIPIIGRKIPVFYFPKYVSDEFGTNYLKITPTLTKTDFYIYQSMFDKIPDFDSYKFNKEIEEKHIENFDKDIEKFIIKKVLINSSVPCCYRCESQIENLIKKQWFVDIKQMLNKVEFNSINIFPSTIYKELEFMREKSNFWCISRQLKFGHKIPNFCDKCNKFIHSTFCCGSEVENEVFDAWFISSLCAIYHKKITGVEVNFLCCGRDILFFWVMKMLLMHMFVLKKEPFKVIFCHSLIRDEKNNKLSKSKGNYLPLEEMRKQYTESGLRFVFISSFKKSDDIQLNIKPLLFEFENFKRKIVNGLILWNNLSDFKSKEGKSSLYYLGYKFYKHFKLVKSQFMHHMKNFDIKKAFFIVKDFLFVHFFNTYLRLLKENKYFDKHFSLKILIEVFSMFSVFFDIKDLFSDLINIYPEVFKQNINSNVTNTKCGYKATFSYINFYLFIQEVRSLEGIYGKLYCKSKTIPNYLICSLRLKLKRNINYINIGKSSLFYNCDFFIESDKLVNEKENLENIEKKISDLDSLISQMEHFYIDTFDYYCSLKKRKIELNSLKIRAKLINKY